MITVEKLQKKFKQGDSEVVPVKNVSFSVEEGVFAAIIGKSGSGKSTLLSLLGALDTATSGAITIGETDITKLSSSQLTTYRRKDIGFVFQQYNLIPNLTALENVMLPMEFAGVSLGERKQRAALLLEQVGLTEEKHSRYSNRLSGGEQQRVSIARALANKPKLILADEPTGNLDSQTGTMIFDLLHSLAKSEKTTIVAVTHDLSIAGKTDVVFTLQDGILTKK